MQLLTKEIEKQFESHPLYSQEDKGEDADEKDDHGTDPDYVAVASIFMWSVGDAVVALAGVVIGFGKTWIFLIFSGVHFYGGTDMTLC